MRRWMRPEDGMVEGVGGVSRTSLIWRFRNFARWDRAKKLESSVVIKFERRIIDSMCFT